MIAAWIDTILAVSMLGFVGGYLTALLTESRPKFRRDR